MWQLDGTELLKSCLDRLGKSSFLAAHRHKMLKFFTSRAKQCFYVDQNRYAFSVTLIYAHCNNTACSSCKWREILKYLSDFWIWNINNRGRNTLVHDFCSLSSASPSIGYNPTSSGTDDQSYEQWSLTAWSIEIIKYFKKFLNILLI